MPQLQLPFFPEGMTLINANIGFHREGEKGIAGFYQEPRRRGAAVLTLPVLGEIQGYLDQGEELAEIATRMDLLPDTLRKAVQAGKLHKPKKKA